MKKKAAMTMMVTPADGMLDSMLSEGQVGNSYQVRLPQRRLPLPGSCLRVAQRSQTLAPDQNCPRLLRYRLVLVLRLKPVVEIAELMSRVVLR